MSIALSRFASGDTDYVAKMNSDNSSLEAAINSVLSAAVAGSGSVNQFLASFFGANPVLLGFGSYAATDGGGGHLNVAPGFVWNPLSLSVVQSPISVSLTFTGQAAATYYVVVDSIGVPSFTTISTNAIYSVVWTGAAFGAITQLVDLYPTRLGLMKWASFVANGTVIFDCRYVKGTGGGGGITLTLPTAVGIEGKQFTFVKIDGGAGAITIDGAGTETISGALTAVLAAQWNKVTITSDGVNWVITA